MKAKDARRLAAALWLTAVCGGGAAPAQGAEHEADHLRASSLARAGRCDEALALLAKSGTPSARAALLRGQCHLEGKRYAEAITALDEAQRLDPQLADVQLPLLIARYHVDDLDGAREALDAMPASAQQRPEYHLYRGLLLLDRTENAAAAEAFDRARELAPGEMQPIAAYYSGLAWLSAQDRERANAAFDRAIALAPDSEWAQQARIARQSLVEGRPSRWAWLRAGAEWDSNVVLRGEGVDLPAEFANESDGRVVWIAHGGAELFTRGAATLGLSGTYYGSAHFDLTDFDEHHPTLSPWLDYRISEATLFRLRYDVGYAWIDERDFLFDQQLSPTLYHDWGKLGRSQVSARVSHLDYKFAIGPDLPAPPNQPGLNEHRYRDRDGWGWGATLAHAFPLAQETFWQVGVGYAGFAADGGEYDYNSAELFTGIETLLPASIAFRGVVGVGYAPFRNPSSYYDPAGVVGSYESDDRSDVAWRLRLELERALGAGFALLGRYRYHDRESNVDVFDYDRHVVGVYVTYAL
jgi:tetratricopeptide (TPR) repeat protein